MPENNASSKSLSSPMMIIHEYMKDHAYSYDDRRRAMSLFSSHHEIAQEFVDDILADRAHDGSLSLYLKRIFHS